MFHKSSRLSSKIPTLVFDSSHDVNVFNGIEDDDSYGTYNCPLGMAWWRQRVQITIGCTVKELSRSLSVAKHSLSLRLLCKSTETQSHLRTPTVQCHGDSIQSVDLTLGTTTTKHACEMSAEHPVVEDHTTHVRLLCRRI